MKSLSSLMVGAVLLFAAASASAPVAPPPPQIPYGPPINLEQAKEVMAGAESEARENNWNVVIAILDSGGNLVMLQRLDGAQFGSVEVAQEKAYSVFQDLIAQGAPTSGY